MDKTVRIVLADNHTIFREGLKTLLAGRKDLKVVAETSDGDGVCRLVAKHKPDILLLDLAMPKVSGLDVLRQLSETGCKVRTILLSGAVESDAITRIFELGARGVILKDSTAGLLLECIDAVMKGQYWLGRKAVADLEGTLKKHHSAEKKAPAKNYGLTPREMEILKAAVSGLSNREIAAQYFISEQTVKHHITSIFDKLGVYNRLELTLFAFHHGLVEN